MNLDDVDTLVKALQANQQSLGLGWSLRPGTVFRVADGITYVRMDGSSEEDEPNAVVPLGTPVGPGQRVTCLITSPTSIFVISSTPAPGTLVARIRQTAPQTFTTAVADFIDFDTADYDPYEGWSASAPDRYLFPITGIFQVNARIVWETNATSRRAAFINVNGTTSGTGTRGGASVQAAGAGGTQVGGVGTYVSTVVGDYVGIRGIQNSGGNLDTSTSDGGSCLEVVYLGQSYE